MQLCQHSLRGENSGGFVAVHASDANYQRARGCSAVAAEFTRRSVLLGNHDALFRMLFEQMSRDAEDVVIGNDPD